MERYDYEFYHIEDDIDVTEEEIESIINENGKYVYVFYGKTGEILYVGATKNIKTRARQHLYGKKEDNWNRKIDRIELYRFGSMDEQYDAELSLIRMLRPMYNMVSKSAEVEFPRTAYDQWEWDFGEFKKSLGYRGL